MAKAKPAGTEATSPDLPTLTPAAPDQVEALTDGEPLAQPIPDVVDTPSPDLAPDASESEAPSELVKARVLAASAYGQPNDVIEIDAALAQTIPDVVDTPSPDLAPDASESEAPSELVKARVLAASAYGQPNDVIEIDAALAQTIPDVVDTSPAAVAYAESLAFEQ